MAILLLEKLLRNLNRNERFRMRYLQNKLHKFWTNFTGCCWHCLCRTLVVFFKHLFVFVIFMIPSNWIWMQITANTNTQRNAMEYTLHIPHPAFGPWRKMILDCRSERTNWRTMAFQFSMGHYTFELFEILQLIEQVFQQHMPLDECVKEYWR